MTPEQILAAKAVLDLAGKLRSSEFEKVIKEMEPKEFISQNPIENFITEALALLQKVNKMIEPS